MLRIISILLKKRRATRSSQVIGDGVPWISIRGGRYDGLLASYMLDITVEVVKMKDSEAAGQEMIGETGGNTW